MRRRVDHMAVTAGTIRLASGLSFLVAPEAANKLWGDAEDSGPTASLLLRSMGYRDALIGGLLLASGVRGGPTPPTSPVGSPTAGGCRATSSCVASAAPPSGSPSASSVRRGLEPGPG